MKIKNLQNQKFGMLTVVSIGGRDNKKRMLWNCACECGNHKIVSSYSLVSGATKSCGCMKRKRKNYKNELHNIYGRLMVVNEVRTGVWECLCQCGEKILATSSSLQRGKRKSCGCGVGTGESNNLWRGYKDISGQYWSSIKNGAKARNISFDIDIEYAWEIFQSQGGSCALSGLPIQLGHRNGIKQNRTASLDRIDNCIGYKKGNIQWTSIIVNLMKHTLSDDRFIFLCDLITKKNDSSNIFTSLG